MRPTDACASSSPSTDEKREKVAAVARRTFLTSPRSMQVCQAKTREWGARPPLRPMPPKRTRDGEIGERELHSPAGRDARVFASRPESRIADSGRPERDVRYERDRDGDEAQRAYKRRGTGEDDRPKSIAISVSNEDESKVIFFLCKTHLCWFCAAAISRLSAAAEIE